MKIKRRYLALGTAAVMGMMPTAAAAAAPAPAPQTIIAAGADSSGAVRSEEEWAKLQDNVLEYGEITDLIHEYNVTVRNNRASFKDYKGKSRDDIAKRYRDAAQEIWDSIEYPHNQWDEAYASQLMSAKMSETQAKNLEQQADNNVDDEKTVELQYQSVEAGLVLSTKLNVISYHQKAADRAFKDTTRAMLNRKLESVTLNAAQGQATQMEVLNARHEIEQLDSQVIADDKEIQSLKQRICLATGWKHDANPEFRPLPEFDAQLIGQIDLEADKAKAQQDNYSLQMSQRKYDNSTNATTKKNLEQTMTDNRQKIAADVTLKYQALLQAQAAYDSAAANQALAARTLDSVSRKLQVGHASRLEYDLQVYDVQEKAHAVENAKVNMLTAWETYQACVNGLAATE